jgi:ATP-dependent Lon protease
MKTAVEALVRAVSEEFERYSKVKKNIPEEALAAVSDTREPARLADLVAGHLGVDVKQKQDDSGNARRGRAAGKGLRPHAGRTFGPAGRKEDQVPRQDPDGKTQREYYLNEQMKAIQKELGDGEDGQNEVAELESASPRPRCRKRPAKRPMPS